MNTNPPGARNGTAQAVPPFDGHKTGVVGNGLAGHGPGDWNVDKTTTAKGFSMRGSKTTPGTSNNYVLGFPD